MQLTQVLSFKAGDPLLVVIIDLLWSWIWFQSGYGAHTQ